MTTVYLGMSADIFHHGHTNIISEARQYGDVIVGLLTDAAIAGHKRLPLLRWENRKSIIENIVGVSKVVPQDDWDYVPNLLRYRPDVMVHGTDWLSGPLAPYRTKAIAALNDYGGRLVEVPYTEGVSSGGIATELRAKGTTADLRKATLRRLLAVRPIVRFIEAHNPVSALIAEHLQIEVDGKIREFDGFWSSSLTDSTVRGKPDIEAIGINARLQGIDEIFDVTTKPLIMDADTGGKLQHFGLHVRSIERLGISAAIIEDKSGLKRNSLLSRDTQQWQEDPKYFCEKIQVGCRARLSEDFMIIARIESLILRRGISDALSRADAYVGAGADAIMIHSNAPDPDEVFSFAHQFRRNHPTIPLVSVPTTYFSTREEQLLEAGFNIVIYANHLLRAAYPAMQRAAHQILLYGRTLEIEADLMSIKEILSLVPEADYD